MLRITQNLRRRVLLGFLLLALAATAALAVSQIVYSVPWSSVDGGGGTVKGGVYTLAGAIGQCDAGQLSGGVYTLQGGFIQPDTAFPKNQVQSPWWLY